MISAVITADPPDRGDEGGGGRGHHRNVPGHGFLRRHGAGNRHPLGVLGAMAFTQFMASFINCDIIGSASAWYSDYRSSSVWWCHSARLSGNPGTRITVREATTSG
jgi:hypothetical protein